jgi:hypothetical protein
MAKRHLSVKVGFISSITLDGSPSTFVIGQQMRLYSRFRNFCDRFDFIYFSSFKLIALWFTKSTGTLQA